MKAEQPGVFAACEITGYRPGRHCWRYDIPPFRRIPLFFRWHDPASLLGV
jgi:hypothetical protein